MGGRSLRTSSDMRRLFRDSGMREKMSLVSSFFSIHHLRFVVRMGGSFNFLFVLWRQQLHVFIYIFCLLFISLSSA